MFPNLARCSLVPRGEVLVSGQKEFRDEGFPGGAVVESLPANAGDTGSSPGLGRSHMPRSNWAREPQLLSLHVWSLCSATREATIVRGPRTAMKSGPRLPQLEKALAQKRRPNTAIKINKLKKKKRIQRWDGEAKKVKWRFKQYYTQGESRQSQVSSCAEFLWQTSYVGCRNEWAEYSSGREGLGSYSLIFIPAPPSWGKEGFLSLFSLDVKCHGIGAWWELLTCEANFI